MLDKIPVKTRTYAIAGEYEGWEFTARTNPPLGLFLEKLEAIQQADSANPIHVAPPVYAFLEMVVTSWNFRDEAGNALQCSRDGLKHLPLDLLLAMVDAIKGEALTIPLA